MDLKSYKISITGAVQGVGFRPFIYKLALDFNLFGEVYNDSEGVKIIANFENKKLKIFIDEIYKNLPPLAKIFTLDYEVIDFIEFKKFSIKSSKISEKSATILPDFAICDDCKREFYDKKNHRFHYPFINCTNCGPRLSIIKNLPYDRINTTMSGFKMCSKCQSEYDNPLDRRYHAQPISCPDCGPTIELKNINGEILAKNNEAIKICANLIKEGKIVAIKGLGGFHIICDALNDETISNLRIRKNRPSKPFAIMCKDLEMANKYAKISDNEAKILDSNIKPILIMKLKNSMPLIAPNLDKIGIFIAPTALHLLLFEYLNRPIIATSANISGEAIIYDEKNLLKKLAGVIDFYLDNDREIITPSDDSVGFCLNSLPFYIRTSRGLNPKIYRSKFKIKECFLALGGEMKNQFAIYKDSQIFISPYIGDLKNVVNFDRFLSLLNIFVKTYDLKFDKIIADLHPNFIHTNYFKNYEIIRFQHHYSHLVSVLADNDLLGSGSKFLGFCFDGTGYGDDKKIWGGEIMKFDEFSYERVANFDEFSLIAGENSIKNIYKLAISIIFKYDLSNEATKFLENFNKKELEILKNLEKNSIKTSSLGRIFDAFCAVIFNKFKLNYDGEAGMMIEKFYDENLDYSYKFEVKNNQIHFKEAFRSALKDDKKLACTGFINAIANFIIDFSKKQNLAIVLSGGVFQNQTLLKKILKLSFDSNIKIYINKENPTNDSGIAFGQLNAYLSRLEKEKNG